MRKFVLAAAAAAGFLAAPLLPGSAEAAPIGAAGFAQAAQDMNLAETVQYVYRGRRHCWYPTGWRGSGWYWCGYRWRRGYGWGGPAGWRGWYYRPPAVVIRPVPRRYRGPAVIIRP